MAAGTQIVSLRKASFSQAGLPVQHPQPCRMIPDRGFRIKQVKCSYIRQLQGLGKLCRIRHVLVHQTISQLAPFQPFVGAGDPAQFFGIGKQFNHRHRSLPRQRSHAREHLFAQGILKPSKARNKSLDPLRRILIRIKRLDPGCVNNHRKKSAVRLLQMNCFFADNLSSETKGFQLNGGIMFSHSRTPVRFARSWTGCAAQSVSLSTTSTGKPDSPRSTRAANRTASSTRSGNG